MIPDTKCQTSGGVASPDVGRGKCRNRTEYRRFEKVAARRVQPRQGRMSHRVPPAQSPFFTRYFCFAKHTLIAEIRLEHRSKNASSKKAMSNRFRASLTSMAAKATLADLLRSRRNYVRAHAARSQVKELMRPADCDASAERP